MARITDPPPAVRPPTVSVVVPDTLTPLAIALMSQADAVERGHLAHETLQAERHKSHVDTWTHKSHCTHCARVHDSQECLALLLAVHRTLTANTLPMNGDAPTHCGNATQDITAKVSTSDSLIGDRSHNGTRKPHKRSYAVQEPMHPYLLSTDGRTSVGRMVGRLSEKGGDITPTLMLALLSYYKRRIAANRKVTQNHV